MRHGNGLRQLSRNTSHRRALLRNLATSFFKYEKFETTVQKAKELRPVVERLITTGKTDSVAARRRVASYLLDQKMVKKLFGDISPRFASRNGGYTRIVRTGIRHGDTAEMAIIELVEKAPAKKAAAPAKSEETPAAAKPKAPRAKKAAKAAE